MTRVEQHLIVTRRLILMTSAALALVVGMFGLTLLAGRDFYISFACFGCGIIGGFVSIQQRLSKVGDPELGLLAKSWFRIILIPIYGGVFALVLYVGLLSEIVTGQLFPKFYIPAFHNPPQASDYFEFFNRTMPASGVDVAKLLFWCFVAGFWERFVPQIIAKHTED